MAYKRREGTFTIVIRYPNGGVETITKIETITVFLDKNDTPQHYILKDVDSVIHIPFNRIEKIEIQGMSNAVTVPDIYS